MTTDQRGTGFPRTIDEPLVSNATGGDGTDHASATQSYMAEVSSGGFYRIFTFAGRAEEVTVSGLTISNGFNFIGDKGVSN